MVAPLPARVGAVLAGCATSEQARALVAELSARPLAPSSLALLGGRVLDLFAELLPAHRPQVLLAARFDGVSAAVERQLGVAAKRANDLGSWHTRIADERAPEVWQRLALFGAPRQSEPDELLVRAGARPAALLDVLALLGGCAPGGAAWTIGAGGVGIAHAGWPTVGELPGALAQLRGELAALAGYAAIEAAPAALRSHLDLWGAPPATLALMRALKKQWDPGAILNRGRYVGGL
jgi:glycolate oxidase FAD binding subunit